MKKRLLVLTALVALTGGIQLHADEVIKLDQHSDQYKVAKGIDFALDYTSEINVPLGTEITKEALSENGYINYSGYITTTGSSLTDSFFASNDEYAILDTSQYNPNVAGTYNLELSFVDGQDATGLNYSTVDFTVNVEKNRTDVDDLKPLDPEVSVNGKLNATGDEFTTNSGIDFKLKYTTDITVDKGQSITKQFLADNGYVKYEGTVTSTGAQLSDSFFLADNGYSSLDLSSYDSTTTGDYPVSISFVDSQDATGLNYSTIEFTVHVV